MRTEAEKERSGIVAVQYLGAQTDQTHSKRESGRLPVWCLEARMYASYYLPHLQTKPRFSSDIH